MGFILGRTTRLELSGMPLYVEEEAMALSERRFDARIAAIEAMSRIAAKDEEPAIMLSVAEQIEDWIMRDGPVEDSPDAYTAQVFGYDETRGMRGWPSWGRGG